MRLPRKKILYSFLLTGFFIGVLIFPSIQYRILPAEYYHPWVVWGQDPTRSVIISWESSNSEENQGIKFGLNETSLNSHILSNFTGNIQHIPLTGLVSNTSYYYQLIDSDFKSLRSKIFHFKTAPHAMQGSGRFLAISDTQQMAGTGYHAQIAETLGRLANSVDLILHAGDIVADYKSSQDWQNYFQTASPYLGQAIFSPAIGNHDASIYTVSENNPPNIFSNYFPVSEDSESTQIFYSFNLSTCHFTFLDFQYGRSSDFSERQMTWLEEDLKNSQDFPFRIVSFHCPVFSSGHYGGNERMESLHDLFLEYNVSLVFSGHDHHYEHIIRDELSYIILGSGGAIQDIHDVPIQGSQMIALGPSFIRGEFNATRLSLTLYRPDLTVIEKISIYSNQTGAI